MEILIVSKICALYFTYFHLDIISNFLSCNSSHKILPYNATAQFPKCCKQLHKRNLGLPNTLVLHTWLT